MTHINMHLVFTAFVVVMTIIVTNLLVGLAVDDIKVVQEYAVLKRQGETSIFHLSLISISSSANQVGFGIFLQ